MTSKLEIIVTCDHEGCDRSIVVENAKPDVLQTKHGWYMEGEEHFCPIHHDIKFVAKVSYGTHEGVKILKMESWSAWCVHDGNKTPFNVEQRDYNGRFKYIPIRRKDISL